MRTYTRWILLIIGLMIVLSVAAVYIFIPSTLVVSTFSKINCNTAAASRTINNYQWRYAFAAHTDSSFLLDGYNYTIIKPLYNAAEVNISHEEHHYNTHLLLVKLSADSCLIQWQATIDAGNNPVSRITSYLNAVSLKRNIEEVNKQLQSYLQKSENIYGFHITRTTLTDTFLISKKQQTKNLPTVNEIYALVNELKRYAEMQDASETNFPMLNISRSDNSFEMVVGLPVNKRLPEYSNIYPKRLSPIKDKILTTDVKGGYGAIRHAYQQIELYMNDRSLSPPVIPFEFMVTDRSKEADTSKWLTKIYYPII